MRNKRHNEKKSSQEKLTLARLNTDELRWAKGGVYQDATAEDEGVFDDEEEGGEC
jgi:hypothetical protein